MTVDSPAASRASPVHSHGTDPALWPAQEGGANWIDLRRGRASARRQLEGVRASSPATHALRPIARGAARCQPAPCSHPPPSSLSRRLPTTASHSAAPLRVVLIGTHHAHQRHAQHRHAQRHPRTAASCATAPRSMRSVCLRGLAVQASSRQSDTQPCVCRPRQRPSVHRCAARCTVSSEHVCRGEPCPCPFGVWPMCLVRCPRILVLIVVVRCVFQIDRIYRFRTDFTA